MTVPAPYPFPFLMVELMSSFLFLLTLQVQLTFEQREFEPCGSTYTLFFSIVNTQYYMI